MTDIVLNQLYPGGVMKQLADAAGGVVYDQYAPGGCVHQLYQASGLDDPLDQYTGGGPIHQIEVELEGGGGGAPDWVPADAKIHIDLVGGDPQGRAWVEGTGVVAVDTLLGASGLFPERSYDPDNLVADVGYTSGGGVALAGAAGVFAGGDFTMVVEFFNSVTSEFTEATFSTDFGARYGVATSRTFSDDGTEATGNALHDPGDGRDGISKIAVTLAGEVGHASVDGVQWVDFDDATTNVITRPVSVADVTVGGNILRSITFYSAMSQEAARLLSVTPYDGAPNTAPYDIDVSWFAAGDNTFTIAELAPGYEVGSLFCTDDEGGLIVYELVADETGFLEIVGVSLLRVKTVGGSEPSAGTYNFTVRATDPGGLYVEQEFTVTVTA
jgi:hypothetical protein